MSTLDTATIVIDSSVAAKWVFPETLSEKADEILASWFAGDVEIVVPEHFWVELVSVAWHKLRPPADAFPAVEQAEAEQALALFEEIEFQVHPAQTVLQSTLRVADEVGISAWDAGYLVTALERRAVMWTADKRLVRAVNSHYPGLVALLGEHRWDPHGA